jgi:hypothetical protein
VHDRAHDERVACPAETRKERHGDDERQVRVGVQQREGPERGVHPEHQEFAVREVHHAHDAEDQRQPDGDEA